MTNNTTPADDANQVNKRLSPFQKLDRSPALSALIQRLSDTLAAQRGLPVVAALGMTILSLIIHILWVATGSVALGIIGFIVLHFAIFTGFLGMLLVEPLGRGGRR
jgi:hypothetical protein